MNARPAAIRLRWWLPFDCVSRRKTRHAIAPQPVGYRTIVKVYGTEGVTSLAAAAVVNTLMSRAIARRYAASPAEGPPKPFSPDLATTPTSARAVVRKLCASDSGYQTTKAKTTNSNVTGQSICRISQNRNRFRQHATGSRDRTALLTGPFIEAATVQPMRLSGQWMPG